MGLTLELAYESAAGLMHDYRTQVLEGGLFVEVGGADGLPPQPLTVVLLAGDAAPIRVEARLGSAGGGSVYVEIAAEARQALAGEIAITCGDLPQGASTARRSARLIVPAPPPRSPEPEPPPRSPEPEPRRAFQPLSLDRKLQAMSVSEKVQLALHGQREERQLLQKDRAGVVQASLVRNPKITLDEVTALARQPHLQPDAAEALAEHPSFGSSPQVALALARNPRTPLRTAVEMVARLNVSDLRVLAKGHGVRMPIAQAARKRLFDEPR